MKQKNKPMLATLIEAPFDHEDWLFEIKLDGFRTLANLEKKKAELYSRNFQSFNERFPQLVEECQKMNLDAILDGEIVALDEKGVSHFQLLQNYKNQKEIYFYVFDILYLKGKDLRSLPLIERKKILQQIVDGASLPHVRYLDHIENEGTKSFAFAERYGLEGIIGKKKESLYQSGMRSKNWVKIKTEKRQELLICGFTEPRGSRKEIGALLVGLYKKNKLTFAGHVGGGFTEKKLNEVKALLTPLIIPHSPFEKPPITNQRATWVKPYYLCEVKFKEWTKEGIMRMPIFVGIRKDKPAREIRVEKALKFEFITHRDKLYWKKEKISKGDLLDYYEAIAEWILPYVKNHPISLKRFPNGIESSFFFQKNLTSYPDWIKTCTIEHKNKSINYMLIQDIDSLLYAVNLGSIEIHPWFSKITTLEKPDFLVFDLDPGKVPFDEVIKTAQRIHSILEEMKIPNYCKTSGGRGLHILVPLKARYPFEIAKNFALLVATLVHQELPLITSLERKPSKRLDKIYIDCFQNNYGQTLAAPYSVRAKPKAPVSTPLDWKEVKKGLDPTKFTIFTLEARLKKKGDLLEAFLKESASLKKAIQSL